MRLTAALLLLTAGTASAAGVKTGDLPRDTSTYALPATQPVLQAPPANAFRGESCAQCHAALKDRKPAPLVSGSEPADGGAFDVIVVGGGLAGLTAAHALRDFKVLVLDKEAKAGGLARRESFDGHSYPVAAAYMREPTGRVHELFRGVGLKPRRVAFPAHTLSYRGSVVPDWITGDPARLPYPGPAQARFKNFQAYLRQLAESSKLRLPVEESDKKTLEELDEFTFHQWVDNRFGPESASLADLYSRRVFGAGADRVSAAAGLLFLSSEFSDAYTWDGGLGAVSEAFARELGPAVRTGAFVWRVSQGFEGAAVDYHDGARDYRARARAVVMAVPSYVARRVIEGLPDERFRTLARVRYASYALVPLRLRRVVWKDSLSLWTPERVFTNLALPLPDSAALRDAKDQALAAYLPMGDAEGRRKLLSAPDEDFTSKVLADLDTVFANGSLEVAEARVIRWGHANAVPYPGYLTKVRRELAKPEGRLFFAGADLELPTVEGAVHSGAAAAREARRFLKGPKR